MSLRSGAGRTLGPRMWSDVVGHVVPYLSADEEKGNYMDDDAPKGRGVAVAPAAIGPRRGQFLGLGVGPTLFALSLSCHVFILWGYLGLASRGAPTSVGLSMLSAFWPVLLLMVGVAVVQAVAWSRAPREPSSRVLVSAVARGLLAELPVVLVLLLVPGWLVIVPFFLMPGLLASVIAGIVASRAQN